MLTFQRLAKEKLQFAYLWHVAVAVAIAIAVATIRAAVILD